MRSSEWGFSAKALWNTVSAQFIPFAKGLPGNGNLCDQHNCPWLSFPWENLLLYSSPDHSSNNISCLFCDLICPQVHLWQPKGRTHCVWAVVYLFWIPICPGRGQHSWFLNIIWVRCSSLCPRSFNHKVTWRKRWQDLSPLIWVGGHFLLFFAPCNDKEKVEGHLVWKLHKNSKEKLVKCATEVHHLYRISIQSCTQNWPSPKVQSLSRDWIKLFNRWDYFHEIWHTC